MDWPLESSFMLPPKRENYEVKNDFFEKWRLKYGKLTCCRNKCRQPISYMHQTRKIKNANIISYKYVLVVYE